MSENESSLMAPLQLAGRLIMENGGEIHRVEDTILRMGEVFRLDEVNCFAVPSGFFISYRKQDGTTESSVTRVTRGSTCLQRVDEVNAVSRRLVSGDLTPDEAMPALIRIRDTAPPFPNWVMLPGAAASAFGFALLFGGQITDCAISAVTAALVQIIVWLMNRRNSVPLMTTVVGSFFTALLPGLALLFIASFNIEAAVAGALMPFVPGLAITNAVAELVRGDILSGISHTFSALLTAGMMAVGTIVGHALLTLLGGVV